LLTSSGVEFRSLPALLNESLACRQDLDSLGERSTGRNACAPGSRIWSLWHSHSWLCCHGHELSTDESSLLLSCSPGINNNEARQRSTGRNACATGSRIWSLWHSHSWPCCRKPPLSQGESSPFVNRSTACFGSAAVDRRFRAAAGTSLFLAPAMAVQRGRQAKAKGERVGTPRIVPRVGLCSTRQTSTWPSTMCVGS
jgi:hypothetical protein